MGEIDIMFQVARSVDLTAGVGHLGEASPKSPIDYSVPLKNFVVFHNSDEQLLVFGDKFMDHVTLNTSTLHTPILVTPATCSERVFIKSNLVALATPFGASLANTKRLSCGDTIESNPAIPCKVFIGS